MKNRVIFFLRQKRIACKLQPPENIKSYFELKKAEQHEHPPPLRHLPHRRVRQESTQPVLAPTFLYQPYDLSFG